MEYNKDNTITDLLEKYWAGNSSLSEEKQLKDYFAKEEVATELKDHQSFFRSLDQAAELQLSDDFDERLFAKIDALDEPPVSGARVVSFPRLARYAAAAIIVLASVFGIREYLQPAETAPPLAAHEVEDPEEALAHTLDALRLLGANLKKGEEQTEKAFSTLQTAKQALWVNGWSCLNVITHSWKTPFKPI